MWKTESLSRVERERRDIQAAQRRLDRVLATKRCPEFNAGDVRTYIGKTPINAY